MECGMRKYCYDQCPYFKMYYSFTEVGDLYAIGYMHGECWNAKAHGYTPETAETAFVRVEVGGIVQKPIVTNIWDTWDSETKRYNNDDSFRYKAGQIPSELWMQTHTYTYYRDCVLDKGNRECIFYAERNLEEWNKE